MASFVERVIIEVEARTQGAVSAFGKMKSSVAEAEGVTGKLKAGFAGIGNMVSAAGPTAIVGAFTAAAAAGKKLADGWEEAVLQADKLSTATGLTIEQASTWANVASDMGVGAETLTSAFGKFNKEAAASPQLLKDLGVTADDANGRFVQAIAAISGIEDPAKQAEVATQAFGRSWQSLAPVFSATAGDAKKLQAALADMPEGLVFHADDVKSAKDYQKAMADVGDAMDELKMEGGKVVAEYLIPFMDGLAKTVTGLNDVAKAIPGMSGGLGQLASVAGKLSLPGMLGEAFSGAKEFFGKGKKAADEATEATRTYAQATEDAGKAAKDAAELEKLLQKVEESRLKVLAAEEKAERDTAKAMEDRVRTMRDAADASFALRDSQDAWARTLEELPAKLKDVAESDATLAEKRRETNEAYRDGAKTAASLADAMVRARQEQDAANGVTTKQTDGLDLWNQKMLNSARSASGPLRDSILEYIATANNIPVEKVTAIRAALNRGDLVAATTALNGVSQARTATVNADVNNASAAATEAELARLARERTATITVKTVAAGMTGNLPSWLNPFAGLQSAPAPARPVTVNVRGWNGNRVALGRDVKRAVRAADRYAS